MTAQNTTREDASSAPIEMGYRELPFPPVTKQHILNCSYHSWHPKYRAITPKARLIPLPPAFLEYLRSDGIILPPDEIDNPSWSDNDSGIFSGADNNDDDEEESPDPSAHWRDTHEAIGRTIEELGGKVAPKLNWSAPKDATWIAATNSMECRTPNDIYLLLKSSDFVTHDLTHAFDDTVDETTTPHPEIAYHLVLRKWITLNPSVEFRCFVRDRRLIALCQRDLNHFDFLFNMRDKLRDTIQDFFDAKLRDTFPDPNFTFDVYIPPPHDKVWVVDFNPWAVRTDPLIFSWMELLTMDVPDRVPIEESTVRLKISSDNSESAQAASNTVEQDSDSDGDSIEELWQPEFRLVRRDDPEAYGFATPQYSAHKLPKDVVDASSGGEGQLREFAMQWEQAQKLAEQQRAEDSEDD
ncbi:cell division cycle protein 123 [Pyrenophora tritici-repentis]|uniref:Cell division cycle protein n=1 Tax=Pyrenophora tritici-repentis TaxID=45151 RepID=A0A2W1HJ20_9PLEO|nr:Cell division cycle protein 123 [Pyrenophora tritici-repentis]KAF7448355.1 Cell division cycle protein [Pyrenophora tritici-repentis]KAF7572070.1 cell division cycle protein 123 [Pyrenophora tritici-repentis]KAG9384744.1 Cell division cycle protein 123 [Pyrenophora tritici-repentis]KAI0582388.1 Cell division cycle protein 123 [Pyrenophora tritici-repentis]